MTRYEPRKKVAGYPCKAFVHIFTFEERRRHEEREAMVRQFAEIFEYIGRDEPEEAQPEPKLVIQ